METSTQSNLVKFARLTLSGALQVLATVIGRDRREERREQELDETDLVRFRSRLYMDDGWTDHD